MRNPIKRFQTIIARVGLDNCLWAYRQSMQGDGPGNIGAAMGVRTNTASAAIDAGRWYLNDRIDDSDAGLPPFNHNIVR